MSVVMATKQNAATMSSECSAPSTFRQMGRWRLESDFSGWPTGVDMWEICRRANICLMPKPGPRGWAKRFQPGEEEFNWKT